MIILSICSLVIRRTVRAGFLHKCDPSSQARFGFGVVDVVDVNGVRIGVFAFHTLGCVSAFVLCPLSFENPLTILSAAAADTLKGCPRLLRIWCSKSPESARKGQSKDSVLCHLSFDF